jgi:hypothetical protein
MKKSGRCLTNFSTLICMFSIKLFDQNSGITVVDNYIGNRWMVKLVLVLPAVTAAIWVRIYRSLKSQ